MKENLTFGSVCSGIEASQLAFSSYGFKQLWCSEIAEFPSRVLSYHYPDVANLGDMNLLPELIKQGKVQAPDLLCGGTPCQAFSFAGWKNGLADERGKLTITFIDIANAIDEVRKSEGKGESIILWENVEGVLNDKTNPFGSFIAGLAGFEDEIKATKWAKAGFLEGPNRNVAWRVIDAKYFGLPQQRKRLYVVAGGKNFRPDLVLFELDHKSTPKFVKSYKQKSKENAFELFNFEDSVQTVVDEKVFFRGHSKFEVFRNYTDCLYSAYGTKWNGNAAAYNGSLYVAQDDRIRRFTPLECERLMGFPDNYTLIKGSSDTNRYQAIGNSWAVPVVKWIGGQIVALSTDPALEASNWTTAVRKTPNNIGANLYLFDGVKQIGANLFLNSSCSPNVSIDGTLEEVVQTECVPEKFYLSAQACKGILRRKEEKNMKMNTQLEKLMTMISQTEQEYQTA